MLRSACGRGLLEIPILPLVHHGLPGVLTVVNSLPGALEFICRAERCRREELDVQDLSFLLQPQTSTLVSLPHFGKASSIAHGHRLIEGSEVSVERKYDGEPQLDLPDDERNLRLR